MDDNLKNPNLNTLGQVQLHRQPGVVSGST